MITEILEKKGFQLKRKTEGEYSSPCPFCGGEDRYITWPKKNRAQCIRGCGWRGDDIQLLRDLDNMTFRQAAEATGKEHKINKSTQKQKDQKIIKYDYTDEEGTLLFRVCKQNEPKKFWQEGPKGENKVAGIRQPLYRLPEIHEAPYVLLCEGEKDADSCRGLGLIATTLPGGAKDAKQLQNLQKKHKILNPLSGKKVFILADNDGPGDEYAIEIAQILYGKASEVRIIRFDELDENGDVSDFIELQGDQAKTKLAEKIAEAAIWVPAKKFFSIDDLLDLPDENHVPIIDKGIFPWNSHILIAGESGVGKSLFRLELAIHLAMGWDWQGFRVPKARNVCIFQWENSERTEQGRLKRMMRGLGIERQALGNRLIIANREDHYNLTLKGDRDRLRQAVKESGAQVVIYDCLSNLHSGNENDNVKMREILDVLSNINAKLKTSCILIHHFGKPGENPSANRYRIRGASSITDWPYTVVTITRKPHEEKELRRIEFTKVRDGATPKPFLVERNPETFIHKYTEEDTLVPPQVVADTLEGLGCVVDSQRDLVQAIVRERNCGEKTARAAIGKAVEMRQILETKGKNARSKGYRIPVESESYERKYDCGNERGITGKGDATTFNS